MSLNHFAGHSGRMGRRMAGVLVLLTVCILPGISFAEKPQAIKGGVYDKPFLTRIGEGATVGGYIDMELLADEDGSTFDQHRLVPFIYARVSDHVSVATEIEFEHGGFVSGDGETDGEIKVEFAHIDLSAAEWLNFRGGVILSPLGRFNLTHDSPSNDLTDRPLVDRRIIPTTLSESGLGVFGTAYPGEGSVVSYEIYLVNGFNEDILGSGGGVGIRSGRGSQKSDNNNSRAFVGRLGYSPALGVDLGASVHTGRYTDESSPSERLTIAALDAVYSRGPIEVLGEFATAKAGVGSVPAAASQLAPLGADPGDSIDNVKQNGFYGQVNVHFLPGHWKSLPEGVFTGVVRFDQIDLDTDREGYRTRRLTVGVNFRPTEDTAVKLDVNRTWTAPGETNTDGKGFDALRFSLATYF